MMIAAGHLCHYPEQHPPVRLARPLEGTQRGWVSDVEQETPFGVYLFGYAYCIESRFVRAVWRFGSLPEHGDEQPISV